MTRRFLLSSAMLLVLGACAPHATTVAKVSVGNTGCAREALAVFNYQPEQRSWTAVCEDKIFLCSQIGGRATRCAPAMAAASDSLMLQRARALRLLPPQRAVQFITEDVMRYDTAHFERLIALSVLADDELISKAGDVRQLVLLSDDQLQQLEACPAPEPLVVAREKEELKFYASANPKTYKCVNRVVQHLAVPPMATGSTVVGSKTLTQAHVDAWIAANLRVSPAPAVASTAALQVAEPALAAAPSAPLSSAAETEIRALLDAKSADVLACVAAPRALIEASVAPASAVSFTLRGVSASDPVQGCVRAVLGAMQVSAGAPAVVVHLVRAPEPTQNAAAELPR